MKIFFAKDSRTMLTATDTDLSNILDEMLGLVNHINYLLTLS